MRLPVLTVEVYSTTYEQTVKNAPINFIEQYRILHTYDTSVDACVGFVFPGNAQSSGIIKVEVKFVNFAFTYSLVPLARQDVKAEFKAVLRKGFWLRYSNPEDKNPYPYFVHLSTTECDQLEQNAVQVHSRSSLIIRNSDSTKYWKYTPRHSIDF